MKNIIISFFISIIFFLSNVYGQTPREDISQIIQAFQQLDYKTARERAKNILQSRQHYSILELLETHKILGVIEYSEGNIIEAQSQFEMALSLDGTAKLDSVLISPKIISFFDKIKAEYEPTQKISPTTQFQYILVPDTRPEATLRSFIFPGWGQIYKGQKKKGLALITATGISLASWGTLYILKEKAYDDYLAAKIPDKIEDRYKTYNRFYKGQQICGYMTGALWLYALIDALITQPTVPKSHLSLQPTLVGDHFYLNAIWSF